MARLEHIVRSAGVAIPGHRPIVVAVPRLGQADEVQRLLNDTIVPSTYGR